MRIILTLSHGQTTVERVLVRDQSNNLTSTSVTHNNELLKSVESDRQQYEDYLKEEKQRKKKVIKRSKKNYDY